MVVSFGTDCMDREPSRGRALLTMRKSAFLWRQTDVYGTAEVRRKSGAEDHLGTGEEGGVPAVLLDPHLPDLSAAAHVQRVADGGEDVARPAGREHVRLQLGGREVGAVLQMAEGAPGRNRIGEGHPDAAVHVAAWVEVAVVDLEAALDLVVLDAHDLDPEVSGEAARDALPEALRGDGRVRQAARSSSAPPS